MTLRAGTIFQDSHLPLNLWFRAAWWVTNSEGRASAKQLQQIMGLKSYKTAWMLLNKLRRAMVRPKRDPLTGCVLINVLFIDPDGIGVDGFKTGNKALIVVAVEEKRRGFGDICMRRLPDDRYNSLMAFIKESIEPGSKVRINSWMSRHLPLEKNGFKEQFIDTLGKALHLVRMAEEFHMWMWGTQKGGAGLLHLDEYLNEFTFRFNLRRSRSRGKLFYRLMQQAVVIEPVPYKSLVNASAGTGSLKSR